MSYAKMYPVIDHPNQAPGQRSMFNSYLFAIIYAYEGIQEMFNPLADELNAKGAFADPDDARAFVFLEQEADDLFEQWFRF